MIIVKQGRVCGQRNQCPKGGDVAPTFPKSTRMVSCKRRVLQITSRVGHVCELRSQAAEHHDVAARHTFS